MNEEPNMDMNQNFSRRTFLKTLGATAIAAPFITRGLMARSPNSTLRHASFGADGMAFADLTEIGKCPGVELVAICDVDLGRTAKALKLFPKAKVYQDWRELLDKEGKNLDSANVSTPDHMHAPIGVSAMPSAPKLAWRNVLFGERAIRPRVMKGAAAAMPPRVLRNVRREYFGFMFIMRASFS